MYDAHLEKNRVKAIVKPARKLGPFTLSKAVTTVYFGAFGQFKNGAITKAGDDFDIRLIEAGRDGVPVGYRGVGKDDAIKWIMTSQGPESFVDGPTAGSLEMEQLQSEVDNYFRNAEALSENPGPDTQLGHFIE